MSKYTTEEKLEAVLEVMKNKKSINGVAKEKGIKNKSSLQKWIILYKNYGIEGLERKSQKYSQELKYEVIKEYRYNNLSLHDIMGKYNIPSGSTVLQWERIYLEEGLEGLSKDRRGRPTVKKNKIPKTELKKSTEEDLISENQRLRMENEYLKKLNALVQKREKSENKTR